MRNNSNGTIVVGLIVLTLFALAGTLLITPGPESTQRLGLLFGVIGTGLAAFVGLLKSDQAATQTNGRLDRRIEAAVHRANAARRRGEEPETAEQVEQDDQR